MKQIILSEQTHIRVTLGAAVLLISAIISISTWAYAKGRDINDNANNVQELKIDIKAVESEIVEMKLFISSMETWKESTGNQLDRIENKLDSALQK